MVWAGILLLKHINMCLWKKQIFYKYAIIDNNMGNIMSDKSIVYNKLHGLLIL